MFEYNAADPLQFGLEINRNNFIQKVKPLYMNKGLYDNGTFSNPNCSGSTAAYSNFLF